MNYNYTVTDRFIKYVQIDTQSDPHSQTSPSTEKQKDLGRVLVEELKSLGINDAELDEFGCVYATIPSNTDKDVPTICFCSHMDTSPDASGKDVKPIIHKNYDGAALVLPDDNSIVIDPEKHLDLKAQIGNDIITASGKTLLGADNKAGVAEIMDMAHYFTTHPEVKHGTIKILFTPDEEIGKGVDKVDLKKLNADFGYTVDGETLGSMEDETFSADGAVLKIQGVSAHPGLAKGQMESAIKIAADIIAALPFELSPEGTEDREGFIHPLETTGHAEEAKIIFIIRSFEDQKLVEYAKLLDDLIQEVMTKYPNSGYSLEIKEQYRNMKNILVNHPQVVDYAEEAIAEAGLEVKKGSIRGGTDGSQLSYMGLPCPNIFAGEHAFHSKMEWVSVQDMQKAVEVIVNLIKIWEKNAK